MKKPLIKVQKREFAPIENNNSRRQFLKMGSLAVVGSGLLLSCSSDDDFASPVNPGEVFDLGSGDVGILNSGNSF